MEDNARVVQIQNPKTKTFIMIDRKYGIIIPYHSKPNKPFHRIKVIKKGN